PSAAGAQVSVDVHIGPPPAWRPTHIAPQPGPEFVWVDGYWYPVKNRWDWHPGYWTRAPYPAAYWNEPYYDGRRFVPGYWERGHERWEHDHKWDKHKDRDEHGHGRGRGHEK
ncbi:MAG TPA: hypothetical protein VKH42_06165, partial [Vicinamibacterales bacterium]|nr:hypothetical protein [Vicinamibacterales bacterium]